MEVEYILPGNVSDDLINQAFDPGNLMEKWVLTRSPYPMLAILFSYFLIVLKIGPEFMKNREPYKLKTVLRVYNFLQVLANLFLVLRLVLDFETLRLLFKFGCHVKRHEDFEEQKLTLISYGWLIFCLKAADLLDTVFMVLKKKFSNVTFLHVYHHAAMVFFGWISFKYCKTHHLVVPVAINCAIHAIMYGYYLLATYPKFKEYLWWKKHLTKLQLGQFAVVLVYFAIMYYYQCYIPKTFTFIWMFNVSVIAALFINFYIKSYSGNKSKNMKVN